MVIGQSSKVETLVRSSEKMECQDKEPIRFSGMPPGKSSFHSAQCRISRPARLAHTRTNTSTDIQSSTGGPSTD